MRFCCNILEFVPVIAQGLSGEIQSMDRQISSPCSGTHSSENHQHFLPAQATAWEREFLAKAAVSAEIYTTATALQIFTASEFSLTGSFPLLTCLVAHLVQFIHSLWSTVRFLGGMEHKKGCSLSVCLSLPSVHPGCSSLSFVHNTSKAAGQEQNVAG